MSRIFVTLARDKGKMAIALIVVFMAGWFSFAYFLYTNQILVVAIQGSIEDFQEPTLALHLGKIDQNVKAVILYLNTPGGLAYSCIEIANYVEALEAVKPVIAVMGQLCASGGYYIASFATHIFTRSNTITGSIGVISVWVDMSQYYRQQGINITVWTTGSEKDFGADWRPPTEEEYSKISDAVNSTFNKIVNDIQFNRHISENDLDLVKTGATFSGDEAVQMGLADGIGDIINAIEKVIAMTGMWKSILVTPYMTEREKYLSVLF